MTGAQIVRQLQYALETRAWTGTSKKVFGSVEVSTRPLDILLKHLRAPFAVIRPFLSSDADKEQPELQSGRIMVAVGVVGPGDETGEKALIGGNRVDDDSQGRGVLEIEKELLAAVGRMGPDLGIAISLSSSGAGPSGQDQNFNYVGTREYALEAHFTSSELYHAASYFRATGGVGQVVLQWESSPDRFDWAAYRIERATGATPPATPGSGTRITIGGGRLQENWTAAGLTAGTYSFSFWVAYNDIRGGTNEDNYSERLTRTSITVT